MTERIQVGTVVIGGGQAGLSVGYHLLLRGVDHVILDAHERVGDAWRTRWDSLVLFTPARVIGMDGMPFPAKGDLFPTKDETADYLEAYAAHFELPVRTGTRVERVQRMGGRFVIETSGPTYEADDVVVAMSGYQQPKFPDFAASLAPATVQLHSAEYRNPEQLRDGRVLVVGAGNSGADIALEVSRTHQTWLAGKESATVPFRIDTAFGRHVGTRLVPFIGNHVLTLKTPVGRKVRPKFLKMAAPLVRVKPKDLIEAGIVRVGRVTGAAGGEPLLDDGTPLPVENVIWCTGFQTALPWLDLPVLDQEGHPIQDRGVAADIPGLYFVGRKFQYAATSDTLAGVGRDAAYVAEALTARVREPGGEARIA